ncbi:MAG TPA: hypothetical protein VKU01_25920 [Bryobacteraceae bacterium]|nr:hypothetical protein [Bryobacteraceae bacterium]
MRSPSTTVRKAVIFLHRWLGVALSLLFLQWFSSGIVMMYWSYPSVSPQHRLDRSLPLSGASIRLSPADAIAKLGSSQPPLRVRLITFDDRPLYRLNTAGRERLIYADSGDEQLQVSPEMISRAAGRWTGLRIGDAQKQLLTEADQWTTQENVSARQPLWKYAWPNGEQVYISASTGEVVQYTTRETRFWAWLGAIPHWMYFMPLRRFARLWSQAVIWASAVGTLTALLGLVLGVWMYSPGRRYRYAGRATAIPYREWKRWHMVVGLIFGLTAVTWSFSGLLSMDPFPAKSSAHAEIPRTDFAAFLRGSIEPKAFDRKLPAAALAQLGRTDVKELELLSFDGHAAYLATLSGRETKVIPLDGDPFPEFNRDRIVAILRATATAGEIRELRLMNEYDAYYLDRHRELPLPVIFLRTNDSAGTRYYIDPKTARIVQIYRSTQWVERWLYHGLHSWDFPWLYKYRPLWDIVVISLLLGGTTLAVTALVMAWRVLSRFFI